MHLNASWWVERAVKFFSRALHIFFGFGASCRFTPSCSQYASAAVKNHGFLWGGMMALKRLAKCHPLGTWGYDPVPENSLRRK